MSKDEYDGFYFLPGDEDGDLNLAYFKFKPGEEFEADPVKDSPMGDTYHIAFFRRDANGDPMFDDAFEAVFADPSIYVGGLVGADLYGCVLRKTEKSAKWWEEYLTRAQKTCIMNKLINTAKAVADSKA
jgi:hypothetical protein